MFDSKNDAERPVVLVVEDGRAERRGLESLLHLEGFEVVALADAEPALDQLETRRFDLLISDFGLPRRGLGKLLEAGGRRQLPVIVISGDVRLSVREEALRRGARAFFAKPVDVGGLMEEVGKAVAAAPAETDPVSTNDQ